MAVPETGLPTGADGRACIVLCAAVLMVKGPISGANLSRIGNFHKRYTGVNQSRVRGVGPSSLETSVRWKLFYGLFRINSQQKSDYSIQFQVVARFEYAYANCDRVCRICSRISSTHIHTHITIICLPHFFTLVPLLVVTVDGGTTPTHY